MIALQVFVELLGEIDRALHIGEQHQTLLAFALDRGLRLVDFVGEVRPLLWR